MTTHDCSIRAVLISVGGAPSPILHVLGLHRPSHVWYFCSTGSREIADTIHAQLDWHPYPDFIEEERFEELGPCYRTLREKIPELLRKWKLSASEVLVDYTGGTKTMSAALVVAAIEVFNQFSYVGGTQREKGGLGITVDGKERVLYQDNPWSELAIREVERSRDLWTSCQFDSAARILRDVAPRVPHRLRFETIADFADAMGARHRLSFKLAKNLLGPLFGKLRLLFDGQDNFGFLDTVARSKEICDACAQGYGNDIFLREILDNTLRTAAQSRFEDAAARLYRAMEMQGQIWLREATNNAFVNGRCRAEDISRLPDALRNLDCCRPQETGQIDLSLDQIFLALSVLGHEDAKRITADIALAKESKSTWRAATEKRNTSILAHGVSPVGEDGFNDMRKTAAGFLGFDLTSEANPIPALDPRWLVS